MSLLRLIFTGIWMAICLVVIHPPGILLFWNPRLRPLINPWWLRLYAWGARKIMGLTIVYEHPSRMWNAKRAVLMGNHQSGIDLVIFAHCCPPNCRIVGKQELRWVPLLGSFLWLGGGIFLNRKNRIDAVSRMKEQVDVLQAGYTATVMPEGTRNTRSYLGMLPFKKGGFYLAIEAQADIQPCVASKISPVFDWEKKRFHPGKLVVRALEPISTRGMTISDVERLRDQVFQLMTEAIDEVSQPGYQTPPGTEHYVVS